MEDAGGQVPGHAGYLWPTVTCGPRSPVAHGHLWPTVTSGVGTGTMAMWMSQLQSQSQR
jgi:hypothetical protein